MHSLRDGRTEVARSLPVRTADWHAASAPSPAPSSWGLIYALPALVIVLVFIIYPFGSIIVHAFTRWNGYGDRDLHRHSATSSSCSRTDVPEALRNNLFFALSVPFSSSCRWSSRS